jgi:hypothetical protein
MGLFPENAQEITLEGGTVPFYKYEENGVEYIGFDTSKTGHPEPMVNAMTGLQNLGENQKLVMINHKPPMGLFPKIEADFDYTVEELGDGLFKMTFSKKADASGATNFNDKACNG